MAIQTIALREYLESILGFRTKLTRMKLSVPFSVEEAFHLFKLEISIPGAAPITLLAAYQRDDAYPGIVALRKRLDIIRKATDWVVVYVSDTISLVERRSLIDSHINFIAIKKQFFIPELAMDLREAFNIRKKNADNEREFSPATQAMIIQLLMDDSADKPDTFWTAEKLMGSYKYSRVTLSKTIAELRESGLLTLVSEKDFSTRLYKLKYSRAKTFQKALKMMRNPIKRKVWVNNIPPLKNGICYAGDTALAEYTLLAPDSKPVFAMTQKTFAAMLQDNIFEEVTHTDNARAAVEIWRYRSPKAPTQIVDEISLYLTLKDDKDERVQLALSELKEENAWMVFRD